MIRQGNPTPAWACGSRRDSSIANRISQRQVMRPKSWVNVPETVTIFEDDALLSADLPEVRDAQERRRFAFEHRKS